MSRPHRARGTFLLTLLLAAGCQDYNFNPVGHCLIQPGTRRVTLSNISSADVLFVVDDSGSMGGEQSALASNFSAFIGNLDQANADRRTAGLEPFDFHIAVTSTSMFWNQYTDARPGGPYTCSSSCGGAAGQLVCCKEDLSAPAITAKKCTSSAQCGGTNVTCGTNCIAPYTGAAALKGENYCCVQGATTPATAYPADYVGDTMPCSRAGTECGTFETHYNFAGCGATGTNGVAVDGWPYPQGDFVSYAGATVNPRVLHFDKELYPATPNPAATNKQGFTRAELMNFFGGTNGNAKVGVCGSGEEQALAAARAAIEKARDGRQTDTYARTSATPTLTWNSTTRTAGSPADWFAAGAASKLVVVFVGDEDDCSPTAADPSGAVVWDYADNQTGMDSCALDASRAAPLGGKLFPVDDFVNFFTGLGRDVAAGFILPAAQQTCTLQTCTADALCCPASGCGTNLGAQARGIRLLDTAHALANRGVDVVAGSICDGSFANLLDSIAEIVKPPSGLTLPSVPAADEVTMLRIVDSSGQTRKVCNGPLEPRVPTNYTLAEAQAVRVNGALVDWWFTDSANPAPPAAGATRNVYINPAGACQANPGETYSADYLGLVPEGGCGTAAIASQECSTLLGGTAEDWSCDVPQGQLRGTCLCTGSSN